MTSESELELLVASTDSMCACILTPLGGWSDCVLTCACACVCVCGAVNFGHTCSNCVDLLSLVVKYFSQWLPTLRVAEVMTKLLQVSL